MQQPLLYTRSLRPTSLKREFTIGIEDDVTNLSLPSGS